MATLNERCHGRLTLVPTAENETRERRISIVCENLKIIREELGQIPDELPQTEEEVPDWLDRKDAGRKFALAAVRGLPNAPKRTKFPSPF